jgi:glycosyltransferase involved in cell wall biosynthesis
MSITTATPLVSIVIVNYKSPRLIETCLRTLDMTEDVEYEVVVVDNGSGEENVALLREHRDAGLISTLVECPINHFFSAGNNIGYRNTNPESEFILLLNSDVAFLRPDWLAKQLAWMEGTQVTWGNVWCNQPTVPTPGPRDIVSIGWSYDAAIVPSHARPEGWCYLVRRLWWRDLDENFPMGGGLEHAAAIAISEGAKCGVLSQYPSYLVHREGGSGEAALQVQNTGYLDMPGWWRGLFVECLDFTLGPSEHDTYLLW